MTSRKAREVSNKKIDVIRESLKIFFRNDECKMMAMDCISDVITDQIDNKTEQKTGILRSDLIFSMIGFYKPVFSLVKEVLYKTVLTSERKNIWDALSTVSTVSCLLDRFGDDNNLMFPRKIKYRLVTKITTTAWKETF